MGILSFLKILLKSDALDASVHVHPQEAFTRLKGANAPQLIDVRTAGEKQHGYIAGAFLIPLHELEKRLGEIDPTRPVLVYCQSGHRSGMALRLMKEKGFHQVSHISGGVMAWLQNGLPLKK